MRILLAESHELICSAIACLLEHCGYEVAGRTGTAADVAELWCDLRPDVLLLDLHMPGLDGIATLEAIRAEDTNARSVLLSNFDGEEIVIRSLRAGACGYLLKSGSPQMLCRCLDTVHAGGRFLSPELADRLATWSGAPTPTQREMDVLTGVARGLCNKRIGRDLGIGEGTVKAHLKSILRKLDAASRTEAALIAIRRGLVQL